jgi:hypothetical protein
MLTTPFLNNLLFSAKCSWINCLIWCSISLLIIRLFVRWLFEELRSGGFYIVLGSEGFYCVKYRLLLWIVTCFVYDKSDKGEVDLLLIYFSVIVFIYDLSMLFFIFELTIDSDNCVLFWLSSDDGYFKSLFELMKCLWGSMVC